MLFEFSPPPKKNSHYANNPDLKWSTDIKFWRTSPDRSTPFITTEGTPSTFDNATTTDSNPHTSTEAPPVNKTVCKKGTYFDFKWPETSVGKYGLAHCPTGKYGEAKWKCGAEGSFIDGPTINCEFIDCSKSPMQNDSSTYLADYFASCTDKSDQPLVHAKEVMGMIQERIRRTKETTKEGSLTDAEEVVSKALGVFDRLIADDVLLWDKMGKEEKKSMAMNIIKETEDIAWWMGCKGYVSQMKKQNLDMQVIALQESSEVRFELDDGVEDFVNWPADIESSTAVRCNGKKVSFVVAASYRNLQKMFQSGDDQYNITSNIVSLSMGNFDTYNLSDFGYIQIGLNHPSRPTDAVPRCVFLNFNPNRTSEYGVWDTYGCETIVKEENYTECKCNHLTHFAILMDFTGSKYSTKDDCNLTLLSRVLSSLSCVALFVTAMIYIGLRSLRNRRNIFTCNLAVCLLIMNILVQAGLKRTEPEIRCYMVSVLLQFCVLSSFMWMLLEGVLLYQMVIMVFETTRIRLPAVYAIAYGIPVLIITVSSSVRSHQMIREKYCWPSIEKGMIWSVVGPIALVITINIIIFAMTMNIAIRSDRMNTDKTIQERKKNLMVFSYL